jgi:phosphatidylglycerol:prolipoprotein diacylglycerol transferase
MGYSSWMTLAIICGLGLTWLQARQSGLPFVPILDAALAALVVGIVGARAGYVALNWAYFYEHLDKAIQWWRGGLDWHTGLVAGLAGAIAYARRERLPVRNTLDLLAPGLALGCALGWLACHAAHCAYGAPIWPDQPLWFLAADLPDAYGLNEPRIPAQLLGGAWALLVCGLLLMSSRVSAAGHPWPLNTRRWISWPGARFALFVCLYSAGLFVLGFTRGDQAPTIGSLRLEQAANAALAILATLYLIFWRRPAIDSATVAP